MSDNRNTHQKRHYKALNSIVDEAVQHAGAYLSDLSDAQLAQAYNTVVGLSTTNCGWTIYSVRELLKDLIDIEARTRIGKKSASA